MQLRTEFGRMRFRRIYTDVKNIVFVFRVTPNREEIILSRSLPTFRTGQASWST